MQRFASNYHGKNKQTKDQIKQNMKRKQVKNCWSLWKEEIGELEENLSVQPRKVPRDLNPGRRGRIEHSHRINVDSLWEFVLLVVRIQQVRKIEIFNVKALCPAHNKTPSADIPAQTISIMANSKIKKQTRNKVRILPLCTLIYSLIDEMEPFHWLHPLSGELKRRVWQFRYA